jgi:hypothetical protein
MKTIRLLQSLLIALGVFSGVVFAHGECPGTGVIDYSSMTCFFPDGSSPPMTIGVPSSGSSSGSSGSARPQPPKIINRYGAFAYDRSNNKFGYGNNKSSQSLANAEALKSCATKGCKVFGTYSNQCAALVWGKKRTDGGIVMFDVALNQRNAEEAALRSCSKKAQNCQVLISECSKYN